MTLLMCAPTYYKVACNWSHDYNRPIVHAKSLSAQRTSVQLRGPSESEGHVSCNAELAGIAEPVHSLEAGYASKVLGVVGDERDVQGHGVGRDERVEGADRFAP